MNDPNALEQANARLLTEWDKEDANHAAEQRRRAECFEDLVAALEGVIRVADRATDEFDKARAALAKAKGEETKR